MKKISLLFIFIFLSGGIWAQDNNQRPKTFIDTLDGALDVSHYLYNLHGFLPVPSLVTEPAVGYGGILAGAFFIPKKNEKRKGFRIPDIAALGGGYTQNGTWFAGAGYFGFWKDDHIRYRGVAGYADVNLKYYGRGEGFLEENPAKFNIKAFGFVQQVIFRVKDSHWYLGGKYMFTNTKVTLFEESDLPWFDPVDFSLKNSGIGLIAEYEHFNNIFSPEKGLRVNVTYNQYLELLGSDRDYGLLKAFFLYYLPVIKYKWISGFRLEGQTALGEPPFYAYPFIILRGVPVMRYQGRYTGLAETEQSWLFSRRWSLVGFAGYGQTFNDRIEGKKVWNAGLGFRYLLARVFGIKMGIDIARGPETWAFYVVFGNSWLR